MKRNIDVDYCYKVGGYMNSKLPEWKIPRNISGIVDEEGEWESDQWDPIRLTVSGGIQYKNRDIPLCWQVEFDPSDSHFQAVVEKLLEQGLSADGYGWCEYVKNQIKQKNPEILGEVQFGDTEASTFIAWVEAEKSCKKLMSLIWESIN